MRQPLALGDARSDSDRPVDARRDDAVDALRLGQLGDTLLVLGGDDRPPIRVLKAGRTRVAIERDHEEPSLARRRQQPELRRPGP